LYRINFCILPHNSSISPPFLLSALTEVFRYEKPSKIQATSLPKILENKNVIAQAQSGAGKTLAFLIGVLAKINTTYQCTQGLILTPTRELVHQIMRDIIPLATYMPNFRVEQALQGTKITSGSVCQAHVVVGAPRSIVNWIRRNYLRTDYIFTLAIDEADQMVRDRGLGADTIDIKKKLRSDCQSLFFSATFTPEVLTLAKKLNPSAYIIRPVRKEELVLDVIFQVKINVTTVPGGKLEVLQNIYDFLRVKQSIIFVERRENADQIAALMRQKNFEISVLHGGLQGIDRDIVMSDFRKGKSKVLITTNVLARGVDVPEVAVVVNYDVPVKREDRSTITADPDTYLHRIGRCGRFGRKGTAITFLENEEDAQFLRVIEEFYMPSGKPMLTEWDARNMKGLKIAIQELPEGGEILPDVMLTAGAGGGSGGEGGSSENDQDGVIITQIGDDSNMSNSFPNATAMAASTTTTTTTDTTMATEGK
jgi:ATP-dependent RNA helicase DDX19/DBP5